MENVPQLNFQGIWSGGRRGRTEKEGGREKERNKTKGQYGFLTSEETWTHHLQLFTLGIATHTYYLTAEQGYVKSI